MQNDFNRDGNPPGSSRLFGMLWDEATNEAWLDANQDGRFTDERTLGDFNATGDFGEKGHVGYLILRNHETKQLRLTPLVARHLTSLAAAAAGHGVYGGAAHGVAPGAQLAWITLAFPRRTEAGLHGFVAAMIAAARDPDIDVITTQAASFFPVTDGMTVPNIVTNRIVERTGKPVFVSAGNTVAPGLSAQFEGFSAATNVMSVGGSISADTWAAVFGVNAPRSFAVSPLSARGPATDGGLKPDFVAPLAAVLPIPRIFTAYQQEKNLAYRLPLGLRVNSGTSVSSPIAAGAAASLIGAARAQGLNRSAREMNWALEASGHFLPGFQAHEQGWGLIDLPDAWRLLQRPPILPQIHVRAPVRHVRSHLLPEPHTGRGLYEREGWGVGESGMRAIRLRRTSGPAAPVAYRLAWRGGDGTFSLPHERVMLGLGVEAVVEVNVAIKTHGVHSAILEIVDEQSGLPVEGVLCTVVAPHALLPESRRRRTVELTRSAEWLGYDSTFVNVPIAGQSLIFEARAADRSLKFSAISPSGRQVELKLNTDSNALGKWSATIESAETGAWEITAVNADTRRPEVVLRPHPSARYRLRVTRK